MKYRTDYVSNSSSSSYIIIGKLVGNVRDNIGHLLEKGKTYIMEGREMCDGVDVISMTKEIADWFFEHDMKGDRKYTNCVDGDIIEVVLSIWEPKGDRLPPVEEGMRIWAFNKDHSSSFDMKTVERNYPEQ